MPRTGQSATNHLRKGERATYERLRAAIALRGENDPLMRECLDILARMAAGELRTRYVGDQYRAIREILDRAIGTPVARMEHGGVIEHRVSITEEPSAGGD
jgi:hypothetical protein